LRSPYVDLDFISICTYIVCMKEITFVWDDQKELANRAKHGGIGFDEIERFIIMGFSYNLRLLVVCHCYRELDSVIRIISARKALTKEESALKTGCF